MTHPILLGFFLFLVTSPALVEVEAQTLITRLPFGCEGPENGALCPPQGTLTGYSTCGSYVGRQSCGKFCFKLMAQHLITTCFETKPTLALSARMYHACIRQCRYGKYRLSRLTRSYRRRRNKNGRNLGVMVAVGAESTSNDAVIRASRLVYEIEPPQECARPSPVPGVPQTGCARNARCLCWYCRHSGHRCPSCC